MHNLIKFRRYTAQTVQLVLTRNLRGQSRNRDPPKDAPLNPAQTARPQVLPADHPLQKPEKDESLSPTSLFSLSEAKMKELAKSMNPVMKPEPITEPETLVRSSQHTKYLSLDIKEVDEPITHDNQYDKLAEKVTPYYKMRYSTQLEEKEKKACKVLNILKGRLKQVTDHQLPAPQPRLACPLQTINPSPVLEEYRNKDEFVVRPGVDGNPKTVGFITGQPGHPDTVCVSPAKLVNIRRIHKHFCEHFERFIRLNRHPTCLHFRDAPGVWRSAIVRSNKQGHLMAVVIIHPHTLSQADEKEIEEDLIAYFVRGPGAEVGVTSLYIQTCPHTRCTREQAPYRLLHGTEHITEQCGGLDFALSPDTFFQINTEAAELLYSTVRRVSDVSPLTTLLDVCCGTGSLSLLLSKHVRGAVGIEQVSAAVADANANARLNGITNATFIPGPAERVLPPLTPELSGCSDLLAVVNPGRGGIHPRVIHSLRSNLAINRLLYISCRPEGYALDNFVSLGNCKKGNKLSYWPPLLPRYAFTVDMFPHTEHYEMGVLFQREQG